MTYTFYHLNEGLLWGAVRLPLPPLAVAQFGDELDLYVRFMRAVRGQAEMRAEPAILLAIQGAAGQTRRDEEDASLVLAALGLRAPRGAFPASFLLMVDQAVDRARTEGAGLASLLQELVAFWALEEEERRPVRAPVAEIAPPECMAVR